MKEIDLDSWNRRDVFRFFRDFDDPYFSITANVDVTGLYLFCKEQSLSFSLSTLHCAIKAANTIREFRIRLIDGKLYEFELVHGSQPILLEDDSFRFCLYEFCDDIVAFNSHGRETGKRCRESNVIDEHPERLDQIFFSVIPWVSFTSFKNAQQRNNSQAVPRIVFGKFFEQDGKRLMPVAVEVHHAMMDGVHVGRFFERFQTGLDNPR